MKPGGSCLLFMFWDIYHHLTSVTPGLHLDQMIFVDGKCWIGV